MISPVAWQFRAYQENGASTPAWKPWEQLSGPHMAAQVAKIQEHIAEGYQYELRPLYTGPVPELIEAVEKLMQLPTAINELEVLDRGIGTSTRNAAWLDVRNAIKNARD